jgi:hypothetical protein
MRLAAVAGTGTAVGAAAHHANRHGDGFTHDSPRPLNRTAEKAVTARGSAVARCRAGAGNAGSALLARCSNHSRGSDHGRSRSGQNALRTVSSLAAEHGARTERKNNRSEAGLHY